VRPEWAAAGHGQSEDADLPHHVPGLHPLRDVHLQTGGHAGSVPGHHSGAGGQHRRELGPLHELRLLPEACPRAGWEAPGGCPQVRTPPLVLVSPRHSSVEDDASFFDLQNHLFDDDLTNNPSVVIHGRIQTESENNFPLSFLGLGIVSIFPIPVPKRCF